MSQKCRYKKGLLLGHIELTEKQQEFFKILTNPKTKVVFIKGPAGSSKSFISVYAALHLYNEDNKRDIMYMRTVVESAERSMGFLKGDADAKFANYLAPLEDKIKEILNEQETDYLKKKNKISGIPINFIRGQDWKNKTVIFDENQNASLKETITAFSRINHNSRLFICGDPFQSDIKNSGFLQLCNLFDTPTAKKNGVHVVEFTKDDIMRDGVVSYMLEEVEKII